MLSDPLLIKQQSALQQQLETHSGSSAIAMAWNLLCHEDRQRCPFMTRNSLHMKIF
jgi:hypothetical protein